MKKGFERFKRKLRRQALIKGILFGLSCGAVASAAYMVIQKMSTFTPDVLITLAIGVGTALVVGLVTNLILWPSEKKIAKKIDDDLNFGEKVQTMLAYRDEDSVMLTLQREDTEERLVNTPSSAVRYRHQWKHGFAPLVATALVVMAVILPVKAIPVEEEPPEEDFEMTSIQEAELLDLIKWLKGEKKDETECHMEPQPRQATIAELEALLQVLRTTDLKSKEMKQTVINTIVKVNRIVREANTNDDFEYAMLDDEDVFISSLGGSMSLLSSLEMTKTFTNKRGSLEVDDVSGPLAELIEKTQKSLESIEEDIDPQDEAYMALTAFVEQLENLNKELATHSKAWAQDALDEIFEATVTDLEKAFRQQNFNKDAGDKVVTTLMDIFEISEDEVPADEVPKKKPQQSQDSDSELKEDENQGSQGGIGSGNLLFGSDDVIMDPERNEQVVYGEVFDKYYSIISQKRQDGVDLDEIEQYIVDYLNALTNGLEKETD